MGIKRYVSPPSGGATPYSTTGALGAYSYALVTHAAVPMGDELFYTVQVEPAARTGESQSIAYSSNAFLNLTNENVNGLSWQRTGVNTGNFSSGITTEKIVINCGIEIAGTMYTIAAIGGDGSGAGSVTLSGDPATGAITTIRGMEATSGFSIRLYNSGATVPLNNWFYCTTAAGYGFPSYLVDSLTSIASGSNFNNLQATLKGAISIDGGSTWIYYDLGTAAWDTMTITPASDEWATKGCIINSGAFPDLVWRDDTGAAHIPLGAWQALDLSGAGGEIQVAMAINCTVGASTPTWSQGTINYDEASYFQTLPISDHNDFSSQTVVRRLSTTTALFYNATANDYTDSTLTVWVP